jgi:hypothetical protein
MVGRYYDTIDEVIFVRSNSGTYVACSLSAFSEVMAFEDADYRGS